MDVKFFMRTKETAEKISEAKKILADKEAAEAAAYLFPFCRV